MIKRYNIAFFGVHTTFGPSRLNKRVAGQSWSRAVESHQKMKPETWRLWRTTKVFPLFLTFPLFKTCFSTSPSPSQTDDPSTSDQWHLNGAKDVHPYGDLYDRVASCTRMTEKDAMSFGETARRVTGSFFWVTDGHGWWSLVRNEKLCLENFKTPDVCPPVF
jgi:hypothetical protein